MIGQQALQAQYISQVVVLHSKVNKLIAVQVEAIFTLLVILA